MASDGCAEPTDTTTDSYATFATWPCTGGARTQQRLVLLSNGQIRRDGPEATGVDARCLVTTNANPSFSGSTVRWDWCANATATADWRARSTWTSSASGSAPGTLSVRTTTGVVTCLQGAADAEWLTLQPCSGAEAQQWRWEPYGTAPADPVLQLRSATAGTCLEPSDVVTDSYATFVTWPCLGAARTQQRLVRLSNGQIRRDSPSVTGVDARCLVTTNANPSFAGSTVRWDWCANATANADWRARSTWTYAPDPTTAGQGQLQVRTTTGTTFCLQGALDAESLTLQTCTTTTSQQWRWQPFGTAPATSLDEVRTGQLRNVGRAGCAEPTDTVTDSYATFISWPCRGGSRIQQRLTMLRNGQIRRDGGTVTGVDARCLVANNLNPSFSGSTVRWDWCANATANADWRARSTWTTTGSGELEVRLSSTTGVTSCLQGGLAGQSLTLRPCGGTGQRWRWQSFGTDAADPFGLLRTAQLRNVGTGRCAEPDSATSPGAEVHLVAWPCVGGTRTQQRLVLLNNGQVRREGSNHCLTVEQVADAAFAGSNVRWEPCPTPAAGAVALARTTWVHQPGTSTSGPIEVRTTAGMALCLQGAPEAEQLTIQPCTPTAADQAWTIEPFGAEPIAPRPIGQLRNVASDGCAEPIDVAVDSYATFATWPCAGEARPQQQLVLLTNGQLRRGDAALTGVDARCLVATNANPAFTGSTVRWDWCVNAMASADWRARSTWTRTPDATGAGPLTLRTTTGATFCLQGGADTEGLTLQPCSGVAAQRWRWQPVGTDAVSPLRQLRATSTGTCAEPRDPAYVYADLAAAACDIAGRPQQALAMLANGQVRTNLGPAGGEWCLYQPNGTYLGAVRFEYCSALSATADLRARSTWRQEPLGDGRVQLRLVHATTGAVTCLRGASAGTTLATVACTAADDQRWSLDPVPT